MFEIPNFYKFIQTVDDVEQLNSNGGDFINVRELTTNSNQYGTISAIPTTGYRILDIIVLGNDAFLSRRRGNECIVTDYLGNNLTNKTNINIRVYEIKRTIET